MAIDNSIIKYHLVNEHNYGKYPFLMGKSSINGPFSMAMLLHKKIRYPWGVAAWVDLGEL
jgi:hypothetical protein